MFFTLIIPVFNRPQELAELLESLAHQTLRSFEVIVVEDGSTECSQAVVDHYQDQFPIRYIEKPNTGPGDSRNVGFRQAKGDFWIVLDSDCVLPAGYLAAVAQGIATQALDAFGGPDAAAPDFNALQRAISYAMTSWLTTGGIRGQKKHLGNYQARSFNMGISPKVFAATGGFSDLRVSEDIDLSLRIRKQGFRLGLIPVAFVYHKRRATWKQFFRQTFSFGQGRMNIVKLYPAEFKWVHTFPSLFVGYVLFTALLLWWRPRWGMGLSSIGVAYGLALWGDAWRQTGSVYVAWLSLWAAWVQLTGYGLGFLYGLWQPKRSGRAA